MLERRRQYTRRHRYNVNINENLLVSQSHTKVASGKPDYSLELYQIKFTSCLVSFSTRSESLGSCWKDSMVLCGGGHEVVQESNPNSRD